MAGGTILIGFLLTWGAILAAVYGGFGTLAVAVLLVAMSYVWAPQIFLGAALVSIIFQNALLATVIQAVRTATDFQAGQAMNFLVLLVGGAIAIVRLCAGKPATGVAGILRPVLLFVAVLGVFGAIGAVRVDVPSSLAYLRLFLTPCLAIAIGLDLAPRVTRTFVTHLVALIAVLLVVWSAFELLVPAELYRALSFSQFYGWKAPTIAQRIDPEYLHDLSMWSWLNLSGQFGLKVMAPRLFGPTIHPISFGYVLSILAVVLAYRGRWGLTVMLIIPALFIGAKGPLAIALLPILIYLFSRLTGIRPSARNVTFAVMAYSAIVIAYGVVSHDIHVAGLISGLTSLVDPVGRGLGVGGNVSSMNKARTSYVQFFQGGGMLFPMESAVGVLLYQVGVFALPLLIAFRRTVGAVSEIYQHDRSGMILLAATVAMFCNGLFQEEAYAPGAAGLALLLVVIMLPQPARTSTAARKASA